MWAMHQAVADNDQPSVAARRDDAPSPGGVHATPSGDLRMVEQLLDRCWREIEASKLNVKLTDIVRLLELKSKLSPSADAERTFWEIIDQMRAEELADFGVSTDGTPPRETQRGDDNA